MMPFLKVIWKLAFISLNCSVLQNTTITVLIMDKYLLFKQFDFKFVLNLTVSNTGFRIHSCLCKPIQLSSHYKQQFAKSINVQFRVKMLSIVLIKLVVTENCRETAGFLNCSIYLKYITAFFSI